MLRHLFHWAALSAMLVACAQSGAAPTPTQSPVQPARTVVPTLLPFPTALPTATAGPTPVTQSIFPPVTNTDWQLGPANARVAIIEYGDFQ